MKAPITAITARTHEHREDAEHRQNRLTHWLREKIKVRLCQLRL